MREPIKSTIGYIPETRFSGHLERMRLYVILIKPRIVFLVTLTGVCAMVLEGSLLSAPLRFAAVLLGIIMAAGSAGALNQFYDRDIDAIMDRTRSRRPIPAGDITPRSALCFGLLTGIMAIGLLQVAGNTLAAALGLGTIFWYVLVYTIWLKRKTPLNIVIGGIAGATTPLIGWAAGANALNPMAWLMFLLIFLWSPPHFWALALCTQKEYALANIPMLPVVAGEKRTRLHITVYTVLLLAVTALVGMHADLGRLFLIGTTVLGLVFVHKLILLWRKKDRHSARELFGFSNLYLTLVFAFMIMGGW